MIFNYPEVVAENIENLRFYDFGDNLIFPSITTMLGITASSEKIASLNRWCESIGFENADKFTEDAATRGTNVHLMIEQLLGGNDINCPDATEKHIKMFKSMKWLLREITKVYGLEAALYSEVLEIAGRCDCIGHFRGDDCIIDFKTSGRIKTDNDIADYWLQCTFYALAHNERYNTNIMNGAIIMGVENGVPMVWKRNLMEFIVPLSNRMQEFYDKTKW